MRFRALLVAFLLCPLALRAEYWMETPERYRRDGGAARLGPYPTRESAESVNREHFSGRGRISGSDDSPQAPSGGGGYGDPMVDAMAPMLMDLSSQMGEAFGRMLFGDPAERARRDQEAALRAAEARARREVQDRFDRDMAKREALELEHLREERHRKIGGMLKRLGDGVFAGEAQQEDPSLDLKPGGSSFFGLGGGTGSDAQPHNDPRVVDLRHLRRGGFLAEAAQNAPPQDAALLLDQAIGAACGGGSFIQAPPDALPPVGNDGLLAFQKANAEYRAQQDSRYSLEKQAQDAKRRALEAQAAMEQAHAEMDAVRAKREAFQAQARLDAARAREVAQYVALRLQLMELAKPAPVRYADVLQRERERIEPTLEEHLYHRNFAAQGFREWMGRSAVERHEKGYGFVNDPVQTGRLQTLADRLRAASDYPDEAIRVRIVDKPRDPKKACGMESNVAAVGTEIHVGREYLEQKPPPTDDQLLFVLGHELGHIHKDHAMKRVLPVVQGNLEAHFDDIDVEGTKLGPRAKAYMEDNIAKAKGLADYIKPQEEEADRYGAVLSLSAGGKPQGIREAFSWIQGEEAKGRVHNPTAAEERRQALTRDHALSTERFDKLRDVYGKPLGKPLR